MTLICDVCGETFDGVRQRHGMAACSSTCRKRGYRVRKRASKLDLELRAIVARVHNPDKVIRALVSTPSK